MGDILLWPARQEIDKGMSENFQQKYSSFNKNTQVNNV